MDKYLWIIWMYYFPDSENTFRKFHLNRFKIFKMSRQAFLIQKLIIIYFTPKLLKILQKKRPCMSLNLWILKKFGHKKNLKNFSNAIFLAVVCQLLRNMGCFEYSSSRVMLENQAIELALYVYCIQLIVHLARWTIWRNNWRQQGVCGV